MGVIKKSGSFVYIISSISFIKVNLGIYSGVGSKTGLGFVLFWELSVSDVAEDVVDDEFAEVADGVDAVEFGSDPLFAAYKRTWSYASLSI